MGTPTPDTNPNPDTDTNPDADTNPNADPNADPNPNANPNADPNADASTGKPGCSDHTGGKAHGRVLHGLGDVRAQLPGFTDASRATDPHQLRLCKHLERPMRTR